MLYILVKVPYKIKKRKAPFLVPLHYFSRSISRLTCRPNPLILRDIVFVKFGIMVPCLFLLGRLVDASRCERSATGKIMSKKKVPVSGDDLATNHHQKWIL